MLLDARGALIALVLEDRNQLRRAMDYLRFAQQDADKLVPSLYVQGSRGRSAPQPTPESDLAAVHDELHAHEHEPPPVHLDPEDNPFAPDED